MDLYLCFPSVYFFNSFKSYSSPTSSIFSNMSSASLLFRLVGFFFLGEDILASTWGLISKFCILSANVVALFDDIEL